MSYLRTIEIVNYQSHEKTRMEFSEFSNVIIGENDAGKTSILRAIEWVATNRPLGDDFIREGQDDVSVQLDFDEASVIRGKDKKGNYYKIERPGKKDEWFRAFGKSVPEEVQKIINFSDVNIQSQHSRPFLLADGSSQAAKYLNRVINLEVIDRGMSNLNKWKLKSAHEQRTLKELLDEEAGKLKRFEGLEDIEPKLSVLERLSSEIYQLDRKMEKIHDLISWIKHTDEKLSEFAGLEKAGEKFDALWKLGQEKERDEAELQKLISIVGNIQNAEIAIKTASRTITSLQKEYDELMPDICPLCGK